MYAPPPVCTGAQHFAQVLRVESLGEASGAHQVAEHHRQLATLGLGGSGWKVKRQVKALAARKRVKA